MASAAIVGAICGAALVTTGCGRLGFDARDGAVDDADVDASDSEEAGVACTAAFCDGFEDPTLAVWSTTYVEGGSVAERAPTFGFRGASLRAFTPPGSSIAARAAAAFPTSPQPADLWLRVYIHASSGATLNVEPIELTNAAHTYQIVFSLYDFGVDVHSHGFATNFNVNANTTDPPRDRWACYELHVAIGAAGTVDLYVDGTLAVSATNVDTRGPGAFTHVVVGIGSKPNSPEAELHVDEVAADVVRIGC